MAQVADAAVGVPLETGIHRVDYSAS
jgi:hypothetical protein